MVIQSVMVVKAKTQKLSCGKAKLSFTIDRCTARLWPMFDFDTNFWGLLAMPAGLVICFGPALIVWLRMELGPKSPDKRRD
jgi:hypothetical protein